MDTEKEDMTYLMDGGKSRWSVPSRVRLNWNLFPPNKSTVYKFKITNFQTFRETTLPRGTTYFDFEVVALSNHKAIPIYDGVEYILSLPERSFTDAIHRFAVGGKQNMLQHENLRIDLKRDSKKKITVTHINTCE